MGKSKNHHWWPVGLQSQWVDRAGDVSWIEPNGKTGKKRAERRKIGFKIHGHTLFPGSEWESNFEREFDDIDNEVHNVILGLRKLKPFGRIPPEFYGLIKLLLKKNRHPKDACKFYHLDEKLHRNLVLLLLSLVIRSPAHRFRCEQYSILQNTPHQEVVGKANMQQRYQIVKSLCKSGRITNQYFVLLHSPLKMFVFGDGCLDWLTSELVGNRISGRILIPLTPHLCVYFCTPSSMQSTPNCASLSVAPWMVDWVNEVVQIYSRDKVFYVGNPPKLTDAFRQRQFLKHKERADALIDILDEIAGMKRVKTAFYFRD